MLAKVFAVLAGEHFRREVVLVMMQVLREDGPTSCSFLQAPEGGDRDVPELQAAVDEFNHFLVTRYAEGYLTGEGQERPALVQAIAQEFGRELRNALSPEDMAEVLARNATQADPQICHSHDFCDANMVMLAAFERLGFTEDDVLPDGSRWPRVADAMRSLWNDAWSDAKANGFAVEAPERAAVLRSPGGMSM